MMTGRQAHPLRCDVIQQPNLFKPCLPEEMQTRPRVLVLDSNRMARAKGALKTAKLLLDHLAQILDQMEAIGDLAGLWGTDPCSFCIEFRQDGH
jgi:hypothetical protein